MINKGLIYRLCHFATSSNISTFRNSTLKKKVPFSGQHDYLFYFQLSGISLESETSEETWGKSIK
jgi:hypothetical protein